MAYRATEKTEARRRAQHNLLLHSALTVVARDGFVGLTILAVAEEANVATGTVYKYFVNKAELCTEVFKLGSQKEVDMVQKAAFPEQDLSCKERLSNAVRSFGERAMEGHRLAYALIAEPVDPMVEAARLTYRKAYADIFSALVSEGVQKGEFVKQNTDVSATAIVGLLAETLIGPLSLKGRSESKTFNQQQFFEEVDRFCLRAVGFS